MFVHIYIYIYVYTALIGILFPIPIRILSIDPIVHPSRIRCASIVHTQYFAAWCPQLGVPLRSYLRPLSQLATQSPKYITERPVTSPTGSTAPAAAWVTKALLGLNVSQAVLQSCSRHGPNPGLAFRCILPHS